MGPRSSWVAASRVGRFCSTWRSGARSPGGSMSRATLSESDRCWSLKASERSSPRFPPFRRSSSRRWRAGSMLPCWKRPPAATAASSFRSGPAPSAFSRMDRSTPHRSSRSRAYRCAARADRLGWRSIQTSRQTDASSSTAPHRIATDQRDWSTSFRTVNSISGFGEGGDGELYVTSFNGTVYQIVPAS